MADITTADVVAWAGIHPTAAAENQVIIERVLAAEIQAQENICNIPIFRPYPDALRQALLRRCARALAMQTVPLGVLSGGLEPGVPGRPAKYDSEIQRYEAPYRRLSVG